MKRRRWIREFSSGFAQQFSQNGWHFIRINGTSGSRQKFQCFGAKILRVKEENWRLRHSAEAKREKLNPNGRFTESKHRIHSLGGEKKKIVRREKLAHTQRRRYIRLFVICSSVQCCSVRMCVSCAFIKTHFLSLRRMVFLFPLPPPPQQRN